jgi:hypothetical protein
MAAIGSITSIAQKWVSRTAVSSQAYADGVANPAADWATATVAAASSYASGVQAAVSSGSFAKGVQKAGTAKWKNKATTLGTARWPAGVAAAESDYSKGFEPFRNAIQNLTLPAKYAKRDPRNLQRVTAVVNAMIATAKA